MIPEAEATTTSSTAAAYNLHRWYELGTGRYGRKDPVGDVEMRQDNLWYPRMGQERFSFYSYVAGNPLAFVDPLGLLKFKGCTKQQQNTLSQAFDRGCDKAKGDEFEQCMCDKPRVPRRMKRICARDNRTIRCVTDREGNCDAPYRISSWRYENRSIEIDTYFPPGIEDWEDPLKGEVTPRDMTLEMSGENWSRTIFLRREAELESRWLALKAIMADR